MVTDRSGRGCLPVAVPAVLTLGLAAAAYRLLFSETSQTLGTFPYRVEGPDRVVALSFDDGPNEPYTSAIADVLAERGVQATFFCVGTCVRRHPDVVRRLVADGHAVGNHSDHHQMWRYFTSWSFGGELRRAQASLQDVTGLRPVLFRPPWLFRHPGLLAGVRRESLQIVSGRFADPLEVLQPPASRLVASAVRRASPGAILILHDGVEGRGGDRRATAAAVAPLVDRLNAAGYRFLRLDDLLGVPRPVGAPDGPDPTAATADP